MFARSSTESSVSVLFSEPKIPQSASPDEPRPRLRESFSALQRAENSSMLGGDPDYYDPVLGFSALQRAENSSMFGCDARRRTGTSFSALQRAENSSIQYGFEGTIPGLRFQCSSASRKFLNYYRLALAICAPGFQCSSASRKFLNSLLRMTTTGFFCVSVLFSEPKIPQSVR